MRCCNRAGRRRGAGSRNLLPRVPRQQHLEHGHLEAPGRSSQPHVAPFDEGEKHAAAPRFRPSALRFPVPGGGQWTRRPPHQVPLRERERPGPLSLRPRHAHRAGLGPPRAHDQPRHVHAVRAVRRPLEPGTSHRRLGRGSTSDRTRFAPTVGRPPTRRGSPSSRGWSGTTRSGPAPSATPSGSRWSARAGATSGPPGTTPA